MVEKEVKEWAKTDSAKEQAEADQPIINPGGFGTLLLLTQHAIRDCSSTTHGYNQPNQGREFADAAAQAPDAGQAPPVLSKTNTTEVWKTPFKYEEGWQGQGCAGASAKSH